MSASRDGSSAAELDQSSDTAMGDARAVSRLSDSAVTRLGSEITAHNFPSSNSGLTASGDDLKWESHSSAARAFATGGGAKSVQTQLEDVRHTAETVKKGFLWKRGRRYPHTWKLRYFVLTPASLGYFTGVEGALKGEVTLSNSTKVAEQTAGGSSRGRGRNQYEWRFELTAPSRRMQLATETKAEMDEWIDAITEALAAAPTPAEVTMAEALVSAPPATVRPVGDTTTATEEPTRTFSSTAVTLTPNNATASVDAMQAQMQQMEEMHQQEMQQKEALHQARMQQMQEQMQAQTLQKPRDEPHPTPTTTRATQDLSVEPALPPCTPQPSTAALDVHAHGATESWACTACTFVNQPEESICGVCGESRAADQHGSSAQVQLEQSAVKAEVQRRQQQEAEDEALAKSMQAQLLHRVRDIERPVGAVGPRPQPRGPRVHQGPQAAHGRPHQRQQHPVAVDGRAVQYAGDQVRHGAGVGAGIGVGGGGGGGGGGHQQQQHQHQHQHQQQQQQQQ